LEADYNGKYYLRLGYNLRMQKVGFDGLYGPSAGLGLSLGPLRLDYAFIPYGDMGNSHQFGLAYRFGNILPEETTSKSSVTNVSLNVSVPSAPPAPVTVFVRAPDDSSVAPVVPQAVVGPTGADGGALVMDFEEASEGLASARTSVKEGRLAEAVREYVDWLSKNPRDAQAWWELGGLYYRLGKKDYAIKCYESVLALKPENKNLSDWLDKNRNRP
jgi:tetratricopeptide (TPR) repeat protein